MKDRILCKPAPVLRLAAAAFLLLAGASGTAQANSRLEVTKGHRRARQRGAHRQQRYHQLPDQRAMNGLLHAPAGKVTRLAPLLALLTLGAVDAHAGACKDTKRDLALGTFTLAIDTTVVNASAQRSFDVVILKGTSEKEKQNATIAPGEKTGKQVSSVGDDTEIKIGITAADSADLAATCSYQVFFNNTALKSRWVPGGQTEALCDGALKISCDKSLNPKASRWNTTFRITD